MISDNQHQPAFYFGMGWRLYEPVPREAQIEIVWARLRFDLGLR